MLGLQVLPPTRLLSNYLAPLCPPFPFALLCFPLLILSISTRPPIPLPNVCPSIDLPCSLLHSQPLHLPPEAPTCSPRGLHHCWLERGLG